MKWAGFLLGAPLLVLAQEPSKEERAMKLYEEAEAYYKLQNWAYALERYEAAYLLSPQPELLFNIGQCYRQLGKYEQALRSYKTYLREVPDDANRAQIEKLIESTEKLKAQAASQPTSEPTSVANSVPTATSIPTSMPTEIPVKDSSMLLWAGVSGAGAGLVLGAFSLSSRIQAEDAFISGDASTFNQKANRAQALGIGADVATLAGLGVGLYASLTKTKKKSHHYFYSVAGVSGLSALLCGGLGLRNALAANQEIDVTVSRQKAARADALSGASDALFLSTALWAGTGFFIQHRQKERTTLYVTPNQIQLSFQW